MKPILFNTAMVQGILDERKTVTRRVIKPQPKTQLYPVPIGVVWDGYFAEKDSPCMVRPPYFPGDILYVRETWVPLCEAAKKHWGYLSVHGQYCYKATERRDCIIKTSGCKWRPSIHMPKEAARIFLRVKDVRVERLQQITEEQAEAEGCQAYANWEGSMVPAIVSFSDVWNRAIKPADRALYGWDANPWVWVIEFERIGKEEAKA